MDIKSSLPYEGKVMLYNKSAHTALVRIPAWVDLESLKGFVNGELVQPPQTGHYLVFQKLNLKDQIRLEFPLTQNTDTYTINGKSYSISFRGSAVVDIEPRNSEHLFYPLYPGESLNSKGVSLRQTRRFVVDKLIPLGTY